MTNADILDIFRERKELLSRLKQNDYKLQEAWKEPRAGLLYEDVIEIMSDYDKELDEILKKNLWKIT